MYSKIITVDDARKAARRRMPKMLFDYIDGAAGTELACQLNQSQLERIRLVPRVLKNTEGRSLKKNLFGDQWNYPFGIAPMGMCNLTWPNADAMLAEAAVKHNIPIALSTMASSTIEQTFKRAGKNAWFQLYVGQSEEVAFEMVDRAAVAGYETLILTVDVPMVAPRPREKRDGFQAPMKIGPKQFIDFASHPRWSITTLLNGVPKIANNTQSSKQFVRNESRGKVDWGFLERLRNHWQGNLVVKGVLNTIDAKQVESAGANGIYLSNHGGRQLDSAPAVIDCLPAIRQSVSDDLPILFDGGVRNGESVIKALALGANFVFMGRPFLYGMGGAGTDGLEQVIQYIAQDMDVALAQLGETDINNVGPDTIYNN